MKVSCTGSGCTNMIDFAKRDVQTGNIPKKPLCPECIKSGKRSESKVEEYKETKPSRFGR
jgi:hypothetical protein